MVSSGMQGSRSSAQRLLMALNQLQELQEALAAAEVDWVLVKGVGLALWAWPDPFSRHFSDIDIFVRPRCFGATVQALIRLGYAPQQGMEDLAMHWTLRREDSLTVELHHDFTREWTTPRSLLDAFCDEGMAVDAGGFWLPLPSPERHLAFVLLHAYNHGWMFDGVWLEDVRHVLACTPGVLPKALAFFPRSWPVDLSLAVAAALDGRIDASVLPARIRQAGRLLARICRLRPAVPEPVLSALLRVAASAHPLETLARMASRFDSRVSPIARMGRQMQGKTGDE